MSEISSGLVAVAEVGAGFSLHWTEPDYGCSCKHYDKLVRLSDAEAIIAQKDASIQRLAAQLELNNPALEEAANTIDQQAERVKELESEVLEQCRLNGMGAEREAALLGKMERQAERIKELESDVDEEAHIRDRMAKLLAETAVALKGPEKALHRHGWQSAALKLAKDAIVEIAHVPVGTVTTSYDMRRIALAAIDALGE